jgi:beta-mannosidase
MRYNFLLLILLCVSCQSKHDVPVTIEIDSNWQFKKVIDSVWNSATVPGNVFSDLLDYQLIEDPFIGDNENKIQRISETDWEYKTSFSVDDEILKKKNIELNFEGLDTYATVYLNDNLILNANNAFREWKVDVKSFLKTENELLVVFHRTSEYEEVKKTKLPYQLPEGNRIFTRKAQFQYGWDWGPKINTSGIWRPIKLVAWNALKIDNMYVRELQLTDSIADLSIAINKRSNRELDKTIFYHIYVNDSLVKSSESTHTNYQQFNKIQIKKPKLWWPHNLGESYLYDIKVVVKEGDKILDSISVKKGLRTIELVTQKDSIGESFYFKVNNMPVYAKGANYIPQNSFQNKVTDEHYEKLLNDVVDANMNMLRVWGGGIYENDIFYDLCDEKGILVWQDFMFACAMYPGDKDFLKNVKQEALDNVKRLRNHASIALWCGNNENSEGWHRWGWQADRSEVEKDEIWSNYLKVFDSILPKAVATYSNTNYWESSPKYGRGNPKYKSEGDAHDWWIWHDGYPFEHLEESVPRFMSEFGFQSFPSYETIKYINQSDSIEITSEGFKNHQKHSRGFQIIEDYMKRDFPVPTNAEDYVYVSQLLQAYGITKGIEAQRRAKPYNMGTLFWQLNDCWPAVSWSSIDYFGKWKALHYKAKKSFRNFLVSYENSEESVNVFVVSDSIRNVNAELNLRLIDFAGNELKRWNKNVTITANSSQSHLELVKSDFLNETVLNKVFLYAELLSNKKVLSENIMYLVPYKELTLPKPQITYSILENENQFIVELKTDKLAKNVFISTNSTHNFSDNYFDMLPNSKKVVVIKKGESDDYKSFKEHLKIISLVDTYTE